MKEIIDIIETSEQVIRRIEEEYAGLDGRSLKFMAFSDEVKRLLANANLDHSPNVSKWYTQGQVAHYDCKIADESENPEYREHLKNARGLIRELERSYMN